MSDPSRGPAIEPLFTGSTLSLARFRCPPDDERWFLENWIGERAHIVFPHVPVAIRHRGGLSLIADPTQVVLYRAGQHYERHRLSPEGDRSTFITIEPAPQQAPSQAIASTHVTVDASDVLGVRLLAELCRRPDVDPLEIEEESAVLVDRILRRVRDVKLREGPGPGGPTRRPRRATLRAARRAVADVQRYLAANAAATGSLADIGAAVGVSPFHLARLFRARTGLSLHGYRDQLRLRTALDRLADDDADLATIANDLGFASHSHFDGRFKRTFGQSPSTVRALLGTGRSQTRTIMEALRASTA
jgi:AraC-like DNA-binding protein